MSDCRRNIEIKAQLSNLNEFNDKVNIAKNICDKDFNQTILKQRDVFFKVPNGRLKLRYENDEKVMLVQYSRPDEKGPKLSKFNVLDLDNSSGQLLEKMLNESNGTLGVLVKTRHLFMYQGRTRIHLDIVKNELDGSDFYGMEYEVCLNENEEPSEGEKVAKFLLNEFQIKDDQLCTKSYFEILNNQ